MRDLASKVNRGVGCVSDESPRSCAPPLSINFWSLVKLPLIRTGVGAVLAAALVAVAFSPAVAADAPRSLPAGSTLYALENRGTAGEGARLASVDPANAEVTWISTTAAPSSTSYYGASGSGSHDFTTGFSYYLVDYDETLRKVDNETGLSSVVGQVAGTDTSYMRVIAISPITNVAYVLRNQQEIYSIDLDTAVVTLIGHVGVSTLTSIAIDPTTGTLWAIDETGLLYTVDPDTAVITADEQLTLGSGASIPSSIQIDSAGIMWIANYYDTDDWLQDLWSVDLNAADVAASAIPSGRFMADGDAVNVTLLIAPSQTFAPAITSTNSATATVGTAFRFAVTASGAPAPTFTSSGSLPAGVTLDASTGVLSGTPTVGGTFTFTITATNTKSSVDQTFTLAVIKLPVVGG